MDKLNNLKQAWEAFTDVSAQKTYTADELRKMVRKRSKNELDKIKRKFFLESGLALLLSIMLVVVVGIINPADTLFAMLFIFAILAISFVPYLSVFKLRFTQKSNIKSHLEQFIASFEKLVSQYIRLSTVLMPVAGLGGFLLGLHSTLSTAEWLAFFTSFNLVIIVLVLVSISFLGQLFLRRYFNWIYGKNIQRLSECLSELENVNEL